MKTTSATLATLATSVVSWSVLPAQAITAVRIATGLVEPLYATSPADDHARVFVVERAGVIRILRGGALLPAPFLDVSARVSTIGERGMLGLAFDPAFPTNRRFYVHYNSHDGAANVARYTVPAATPDVADPASEVVILNVSHNFNGHHNGGALHFGPDGFLYVAIGEGGGGACAAQDPLSLLGKVTRIDTDGNAPLSNPHVGEPGVDARIWARGLRNPFRFTFDRATGDMWIGDVGSTFLEEIDLAPAGSPGGENWGWPLKEGTLCGGLCAQPLVCTSPELRDPIRTVPTPQCCAIVCGFVYRGCAIPALRGAFFHADYCSGTIWSLRWDGSAVTDLVDRTAQLQVGGGITSFGEDADGELLITTHFTGELWRIVPVGTLSSVDAGPGSLGSHGRVPAHEICGVLGAGNTATLRVRDGLPSAPGAFVFATSSSPIALPLPGFGTLVPVPIAFSVPFSTDARGAFAVEIAGGTTTLSLFHQAVLLDTALGGVTLSNARQTLFD